MPKFFSDEAKDLVRWMLQPNPVDRIRFHEIRRHPWLRASFPVNNSFQDYASRPAAFKIDEDILAKVMTMGFNFGRLNIEKIKRLIRDGKEYSFVIAYDLLVDDAKKQTLQQQGN
eukprot:TRINITY_DN4029_c0_g2_i3.p1 TRINITY_DN4029_c0_g2~~TRINITY_DN4029_c0_g2_i3.p1  ORF type:complete len:115 (-),score=28.28 TRINITY_DN4029_c0_g2_i3:418-762(-)